jgi:DNA ligase-1
MKPNLAESPNEGQVLTFPKYASPKLDGIRAMVQNKKLVSRSLKLIPNEAIRDMLENYEGLDGELICGDPSASDVYHKTFSKVMTKEGTADDVTFFVFDLLNLTLPYMTRLHDLHHKQLPSFVKVLPQSLLASQVNLDDYYSTVLDQGYEGAILRNPNALYKQGRSTSASQDMLKMKPFEDSEGLVTGLYEAMENNNPTFKNELGQTDRSTDAAGLVPKGMLGGFVVTVLNGKFKGVTTNIAAGKLKHSERIDIWNNHSTFLNKVITYRHMPGGAVDAPRHARFYRFREDYNA